MGMAAEVIAIGPYSQSLLGVLPGDPETYSRLSDGATIVVSLFGRWGSRGSTASRQLASILGVEPWNFSTHCFPGDGVDLEDLADLVGKDDALCFRALLQLRFQFFFCPNG